MSDLSQLMSTAVLADRVRIQRSLLGARGRAVLGWLVTDGSRVSGWPDGGERPLFDRDTHSFWSDTRHTWKGCGITLVAPFAKWRITFLPFEAGSGAVRRPVAASALLALQQGAEQTGSPARSRLWYNVLTHRYARRRAPVAPAASGAVDLISTRRVLYERAQELQIPGRSSMTKAELVAAIKAATTLSATTQPRTLVQLRDEARKRGIPGRSKMTRAALEQALELTEDITEVEDVWYDHWVESASDVGDEGGGGHGGHESGGHEHHDGGWDGD
jgi:hypothetical protein